MTCHASVVEDTGGCSGIRVPAADTAGGRRGDGGHAAGGCAAAPGRAGGLHVLWVLGFLGYC